jgi:catechol 2,3-dioxygenase-like lactoylglutathione lyase family enzyme
MGVVGFDHVALPTSDAERLLAFYRRLGFGVQHEDAWRAGRTPAFSLTCGDSKINVHPEGYVAALRGPTATPGCGDCCFVWEGGIATLMALLDEFGIERLSEPGPRRGGRDGGAAWGVSVHARDPDSNLIEFMSYDPADLERYGPVDPTAER